MRGLRWPLALCLVAVVFLGCSSTKVEQEEDEWIPVSSFSELEGTYEGTGELPLTDFIHVVEDGALYSRIKEAVVTATLTIVCPNPADDSSFIEIIEEHDFTNYVDMLADLFMSDPEAKAEIGAMDISAGDFVWEQLKASDPHYIYSDGRPYIRTAVNSYTLSDSDATLDIKLMALYKNQDASRIKMVLYKLNSTGLPSDDISLEMVLEKR